MLLSLGKSIATFSFPIIPDQNRWAANRSTVEINESYVNLDDRKFQSASFNKSIVLPKASTDSFFEVIEPNVWIANDFETKQSIESEIDGLKQIGIDSNALFSIQAELANAWQSAAYDSGDAEASLYRILGEVHNLSLADQFDADLNAEDLRVLDSAKNRIGNAVYHWIEVLSGDAETSLDSLQIPEIDFRKLNTAIRSMFGTNWF